jgi:hypothetical protein
VRKNVKQRVNKQSEEAYPNDAAVAQKDAIAKQGFANIEKPKRSLGRPENQFHP